MLIIENLFFYGRTCSHHMPNIGHLTHLGCFSTTVRLECPDFVIEEQRDVAGFDGKRTRPILRGIDA